MALKGKQVTETFGGDKFIFQHPGIQKAVQMQDESVDQNGNRSGEVLYKEFLDHVVFLEVDGVPTRITMDHFEKYDSMKVFSEVMKFASKFIFR